MKKKWVTFSTVYKLVLSRVKKQNGPIRWGLIWELSRQETIHKAQEVVLNPWMIIVKTTEEIQTILEKRMPLSEAEGEVLKDLLIEILPGRIQDNEVNKPNRTETLLWSHRINKTHA